MSNLTILERNTVAGFRHDDTARLYLRGSQKDELKAFWMACQWEERLRPFLYAAVPLAAEGMRDNPHAVVTPEENAEQVIAFIRERHFRRHFPNQ